jgi:hypothetical protein
MADERTVFMFLPLDRFIESAKKGGLWVQKWVQTDGAWQRGNGLHIADLSFCNISYAAKDLEGSPGDVLDMALIEVILDLFDTYSVSPPTAPPELVVTLDKDYKTKVEVLL